MIVAGNASRAADPWEGPKSRSNVGLEAMRTLSVGRHSGYAMEQ
jgi:hypothetical protein